jgi:demethylmenaquinone methyltransferase / 2-methoxy-6-polyprenyl-1,4-benzoquinol methylase
MSKVVVPYPELDKTKKEQVEEMFDNISPKYDLLNRVLSFGIDRSWRRYTIAQLPKKANLTLLDVATGTCDLAIEALSTEPKEIIGIDISRKMLDYGQLKLDSIKNGNKIRLLQADSEKLPFEDDKFDAVMVAFGVRNFENLEKGLKEIHRVLKTDGKLVVLEFSKPNSLVFGGLYKIYSIVFLPLIGKLVSKDNSAYVYLPESVKAFPEGEKFNEILIETGYKFTRYKKLTFGICTVYSGIK